MRKYKIGYTDGTFDMFHVGHLNLIEKAKACCDHLIVGVHGDDVVYQYKNRRPIINESDRRRIISSIKGVDQAVINTTRDKHTLWQLHHFDALIMGDDWKGTERWNRIEAEMKELGVDVIYLPYTSGISTTDILKRIDTQER